MNIDQLERDLAAKKDAAAALLSKHAQAAQAHEEKDKDGKVVSTGRLMTAEEKKEIQAVIDDGMAIKVKLDRAKGDVNMTAEIEKLTAGLSPHQAIHQPKQFLKSMGQQFVESDAFAWLKKTAGTRSMSAWTSPSAELFAATLTEDLASGGDLVITDYRPGILPLMFKRLTVADLLASGSTDSNSISYLKETTFTNAANSVAEGATKPESTLIFDQVSDPVRKIAHWLPVTDEMLEDVAQIRSYIDTRLRLGVEIEEEDQLLNGTTVAPDIVGILNRTGLQAAKARGADTNAEVVFKQMMDIFNASFLMPDGVVMNPSNWQTTQLMKDSAGRYFGAGPFAPAQAATLWGIRVVVTPSIVANTGLVGAFQQAAQFFRKGGIRVEASNSHSDFFVKNLTAIRAEERGALAVYRPGAFGTVTGLS